MPLGSDSSAYSRLQSTSIAFDTFVFCVVKSEKECVVVVGLADESTTCPLPPLHPPKIFVDMHLHIILLQKTYVQNFRTNTSHCVIGTLISLPHTDEQHDVYAIWAV
jgi:hypothetical protein